MGRAASVREGGSAGESVKIGVDNGVRAGPRRQRGAPSPRPPNLCHWKKDRGRRADGERAGGYNPAPRELILIQRPRPEQTRVPPRLRPGRRLATSVPIGTEGSIRPAHLQVRGVNNGNNGSNGY